MTVYLDETFSNAAIGNGISFPAEFDNCEFVDCHLSNADLSASQFIDCSFSTCDLSLIKLTGTSLKNVQFSNCKMLGVHFDVCNKFLLQLGFSDCQLDMSSFHQLALSGISFSASSLKEVDFVSAQLDTAHFDNCNLEGAMFENTNLEGADFETAYGYSINPEMNKMKKAIFSSHGLSGLLEQYQLVIR